MFRSCRNATLFAAVCLMGCGPKNNPKFEKTVAVRGHVILPSGQTLKAGLVTFHPQDPSKGEARGSIGPDGRFVLGTYKISDGVMPGSYTVTVDATVFDQRGNPKLDRSLPIPARFTKPEESPLKVTIEDADKDDLKLDLR